MDDEHKFIRINIKKNIEKMVEAKLIKTFLDTNTGKDMYVLSIKIKDTYHNITLNKEEFEGLFYSIRSIFNNYEK